MKLLWMTALVGLVGCTSAPDSATELDENAPDVVDVLWGGEPGEYVSQCLDRELTEDPAGLVNCVVIEARPGGDPDCTTSGRAPVRPEHYALLSSALDPSVIPDATYCELAQLTGTARERCQMDLSPETPDLTGDAGYCYVPPDHMPTTEGRTWGCTMNPNEQVLHFVGGTPEKGGAAVVFCNVDLAEPI
jgi:hypothetical protein